MDRNTLTALVLMALLLVTFNVFFQPEPTPPATTAATADSTKTATPQPVAALAALDSTATAIFPQTNATEQTLNMENDVMKVELTSKGGRIKKVELKKYKTHDGKPLILVDGSSNVQNYTFAIGAKNIETQQFNFATQQINANSVSFKLQADSTSYFEQTYTLPQGDSYVLDYVVNMVGMDKKIANGAPIKLSLANEILSQEKAITTERQNSGIYFKPKDDSPDYLFSTSDANKAAETPTQWVSFKQDFFNNTLIAKTGAFNTANFALQYPTDANNHRTIATNKADLAFNYEAKNNFSFPMQYYLGPNHYQTLRKMNNEMQALLPLGWGIFGWVNKFIIIPIFNFLSKFISNYGIIILLLTLIIKLVLWPLTYKSYLSFAKMNVLKPELEALRQKHGNDAQALQVEQMKLYNQAGVSPFGGCLPQLLQFPILVAMYRFFPASIELRQQSFLWAKDLSTYDSIWDLPFRIPLYGDHVSLFCLLSAASTYLYSRLNNQMTPSTSPEMAMQMKMMQYLMPIMLVFIFNSFSAGLTYYVLVSNLISFAQQWAIKKYFIDEQKIHAEIASNKAKPAKKSAFQQRMEEAMEEQRRRQQQKK